MTVVTPTPTDATLLRGHHLIGHIASGATRVVLVSEKDSNALAYLDLALVALRRAVEGGDPMRVASTLNEFQLAADYGAEILASTAALVRCQQCVKLVPHDVLATHKRQFCAARSQVLRQEGPKAIAQRASEEGGRD